MVCAPVRRDNPRALARGIIDRTCAQTMRCLTRTMISCVDLAHLEVTRAKDWASVDCGTIIYVCFPLLKYYIMLYKV